MFLSWPKGKKAPGRKERLPKLSGGKRKFADIPSGVKDSTLLQRLKKDGPASQAEAKALSYLRNGAPFKGVRAPYHIVDQQAYGEVETEKEEHKEAIKRAGGHWLKNPEHQEGVRAKGITYGWWCAGDTVVLKRLLALEPTVWGAWTWTPLDLSDDARGVLERLLE